ncbi:aldehyde dehydrogenase family protein [Xanthobacter autotrophicus DSM 431]|uniref:aldehyde dehydrogenase family protein n=1 Tax=Xanthobacter nonsaccharivorans TaxID=3119912 RepID=UPI0037278FEF
MASFGNHIGGEWVSSEAFTTNINPSDTADVVGEFARTSRADVDRAIEEAAHAFPAWSRSPVQLRHDILKRAGDELFQRREEMGRLLSREEGKTLAEGVGEATRAAQILFYFAGECLRLKGDLLPSVRPGVGVEITREPLGVIRIVTPWNFPLAIPAWKIAPALAYGNCVVFKPADLVPACAHALTEILVRAGVPKGVLNLVMGRGSEVGQAIVSHQKVDGISFTGSVATGRQIAAACVGATPMKKVQLEMGGKNPLVVLDDADLDGAVECAIQGSFYSTGQRCTASSRLIATQAIHDRFVDALTARMRALNVGDALDPSSQIGPVVSETQMRADLDYIRIGKEEGACLATGGEPLTRERAGFYLSPALFTEVQNHMRIAREEIFGPVAAVIRVRDYDEALAIANDTPFGLAAGLCTTSLKHAQHFKRNAQAGMVMVNLPTAGVDYHVPFGGRKESSCGPREQGAYAAEFYTTVKTSYVAA